MKPQCGREIHPSQFRPNLRCLCGAPIHFNAWVNVKVIRSGQEQYAQQFELNSLIEIGRSRRLGFKVPDVDLGPYLTQRNAVSHEHLELYFRNNLTARVNIKSKKIPMVVNFTTMRPGEQPKEFPLPLDLRLTNDLTLRVEVA